MRCYPVERIEYIVDWDWKLRRCAAEVVYIYYGGIRGSCQRFGDALLCEDCSIECNARAKIENYPGCS